MKFVTNIFNTTDKSIIYEKVFDSHLEKIKIKNKNYFFVKQDIIQKLSEKAFYDISHFLRASHLKKLNKIINDKEASDNDKFVASTLLKNANVAAGGILPMCQDTGTAIIIGKKGNQILTNGQDSKTLSKGVFKYSTHNKVVSHNKIGCTSIYILKIICSD